MMWGGVGGILFENADSWTSSLDVLIQTGQDWGSLRIPRGDSDSKEACKSWGVCSQCTGPNSGFM